MKIEIPLQFFLVCLLILGVSVFIATFRLQKAETFQDMKLNADDYDIQLQACPSGTTSYNNKGSILCCDGSIVNEMCNGRTVCSVSDNTAEMPSCVNVIRKEYKEKAIRFCPPSLPRYFEDKTKNIKGCTLGKRTADGKAPLVASQPKCTIYATQNDNLNKLDSCDNIKERDLFKCPGGSKGNLVSTVAGKPATVLCSFSNQTDPQPITCFSDNSLTNFLISYYGNDWRKNLNRDTKLSFCSTAQKYYLDRSISEEELELMDGPYKTVPKVETCIFNARMYADRNPDLKRAFGYNESRLTRHYIDFGIREGRVYKAGCRFDPLVYANLNPDVKNVFKNDKTKITNHYKTFGINERRVFRKV